MYYYKIIEYHSRIYGKIGNNRLLYVGELQQKIGTNWGWRLCNVLVQFKYINKSLQASSYLRLVS